MRRTTAWLFLVLSGAALATSGCGAGNAPAPAPAAPFVFENPTRDGVPGESATYRLMDGKNWTLTLKALDPVSHIAMVEEIQRDPATNIVLSREMNPYRPNHFLRGYDSAGMVITKLYPERIRVAGREWDCLCVEFVGNLQGTVRCWFSNAVPVVGLVKQVRVDGREDLVNAELTEWSPR